MVEVSVVVPVYNSEACLEELCRQTADALGGTSYELLLVNDQSQDGSWSVIKRLCGQNRALTGISLRKNAGQDNAIMCGLRRATGRYVAIMDDDLQHSPSHIPALCAACERNGWDVCFARFPYRRHAWWKNLGSWLNGKLAQLVLGKPKSLYLSPFKVVRQEVVQEVIAYTGPFPYVDGQLLGITHNVGQIDLPHSERYQGKSTYSLAKSILVFLRLATGYSVWPLRVASCVGMLCSVLGFALALFYLIQYLALSYKVEGWLTLVILVLVMGGILLFSLGLLGEYLGRLYLSCNGKPQATVKEICGGKA